MKIHNTLNIAEILIPNKIAGFKKKHILSMDLNISIRLADFLLLKKRVLIIQFNREIINTMLPTKFV